MIPGTTSKLSESIVESATSIDAKTDIVKVTGTTTIQTIIPYFGGTGGGGFLILVAADGLTLGTSGNILVGGTATALKATLLIFVKSLNHWVINAP